MIERLDSEREPITVFEKKWYDESIQIFRSDKHGVMAVADSFPRLPLQVVIASRYGKPGQIERFYQLPPHTKRLLNEVTDAVSEKIGRYCTTEQTVVSHTEGRGVPDHAHKVVFAAEDKESVLLHTGSALGGIAVDHTLKIMTFETDEAELLEARLDEIARFSIH